jgi:hypothetical protein
MRLLKLAWAGPIALIVLVLLPTAGATTPVHGTVVNCATSYDCRFQFNTSAGTGWANASGSASYGATGVLSFQLPGEAKASYNLTYSTYIGSLIGTYTYWTVGHFLGTDVNTGHVVYGTTDTNFTITCVGHSGRGGGCNYVYTTDNGTIVVHFTQAQLTATTVSCSPSSINVASKTNCTVTVTNLWNSSNVPTGKVHLSSGGLGSFSNKGSCVLVSGHCSLIWHPNDNTGGGVLISATYYGSTTYYKSAGSTLVTVTGGG